MKACFLRAARRLTGTLSAAFIFILETFSRGTDVEAHPEMSMGQQRTFTVFFF